MQLGSFAVACLAVVPQACSQPFWTGAAPPDARPWPFKVDPPLTPCDATVWGTPICLNGHTLVNVSWKNTLAQLPAPADVIFNNPNATLTSKEPAATTWCANISVVDSRGLTLFGCNKTIDKVRLYSLRGWAWCVFSGFLTPAYCCGGL